MTYNKWIINISWITSKGYMIWYCHFPGGPHETHQCNTTVLGALPVISLTSLLLTTLLNAIKFLTLKVILQYVISLCQAFGLLLAPLHPHPALSIYYYMFHLLLLIILYTHCTKWKRKKATWFANAKLSHRSRLTLH